MEPKVIIFDLDGCLVDTEDLHRHALSVTLNRRITPEYFHEHLVGVTSREIMRHYGIPSHAQDRMIQRKRELFQELAQDVRLPESSVKVLHYLKETHHRLALCSNNNLDSIFSILGEHARLFDIIVSKDQVLNPKPHPDPYKMTLELLEADPDEVIAIEDADSGVASARAAGINRVLQITHPDMELTRVWKLLEHLKRQKGE